MPWTKDSVASLVARIENGEDKLSNMLRELAATQQAIELCSRTPNTVWFTQGFTPEQVSARKSVVTIAQTLMTVHRNDWIAVLLNELGIPSP